MKKILALILAAMLALSVFVACNSSDESAPKGEKGEQGEQGAPGKDGENGITPQMKIDENDFWCVSYDNGKTWTSLGVKATGDKGDKGDAGDKGDGGENGITPLLKVDENVFWCVSYDNGKTWTSLGLRAIAIPSVIDVENKLTLTLLDDYTYGVAGFLKEDCTVLNIPASYNGIPVTKILNKAFKGNTNITEVNIPGSIKTIDYNEFEGCTGIEKLNIAEGVEVIQGGAFLGCKNLKSVKIPDSVKVIGGQTFENCSSLADLTLGANLEEIMMNAFKGTAITSVTIPDKVIFMQNEAFMSCENLTSVTISASVKKMGREIFAECYALKSVEFKNTEGWYLGDNAKAESGIDISSADLADKSIAASYLKNEYSGYYWLCS